MAWEDDDEEESGPVAVAKAFSGSDEAEVPTQMPQPQTIQNQDADTEKTMAPEKDDSAQQMADYQTPSVPRGTQSQDSQPKQPSEDADAMADYHPVEVPSAPTVKPYSTAPVEDAQKLAQMKSDFAGRVQAGDFKPSLGRQIRGRIAAGLVGFGARNAAEGAKIGSDVLNEPLNSAEQTENQQEAAQQQKVDADNLANQQIQTENANAVTQWQRGIDAAKAQSLANQESALANQRRQQAQQRGSQIVQFTPSDPTNPYAGGTGVTADGRTVQNVQPPDKWLTAWEKSPAGQASKSRMQIDQRKQDAQQMGLKPGSPEYVDYVAGRNVVPTRNNIRVPSASMQEYEDWRAAFKKENGREPNAAEIEGLHRTGKGQVSKSLFDRMDANKNDQIRKSMDNFKSGAIDKDQFLDDWQSAQDEFEQRISSATGEDVPHVDIRQHVDPNTLQWKDQAPSPAAQPKQAARPAQAPQQQPQQAAGPKTFRYKGQTFTAGQKVNVGGRTATITGINPKTGKLQIAYQ